MTRDPRAPSPTRRAHLAAFLGALLVCFGVVVWMIGPYLLSLFLGGTSAMVAYPVYRRLRARSWGPRSAASAVTALMLLLVVAPLALFAVRAAKQGVSIGRELAEIKEFSPKAITVAVSRWQVVRSVFGDPEMINASLKSGIQAAGQFAIATALRLGAGVPEFLLQLLLALFAFYFLLRDGEGLMSWLFGLGVFDRDVQDRLVESFRDTTISAFLAGLAAAVSQAALIVLGFLALGVPGAFLAGGLTFFFAWIPMLGTVPATLAGLVYLYVQGASAKIALMIALGAAAGVIDNLIRPLVLKGRGDMHPLVGLVAIIGGIQMFGIMGVFIGPIMAAMLLALIRIWPVVAGRSGMAPATGR